MDVPGKLDKLKAECGYSEHEDCKIDSLIDYKDALEVAYSHAMEALHEYASGRADELAPDRAREIAAERGDVVERMGYPSVAEDVREGVPLATVRGRVLATIDNDEAADLIAKLEGWIAEEAGAGAQ